MLNHDDSGISQLAHGDPAGARQLRAGLAAFARQVDDPQLRKLVADVLAGRRNVRQVLQSEKFNEIGEQRLANLKEGLARLTDEQRATVFDPNRTPTPDSVLDAMRGDSSPVEDSPEPEGQHIMRLHNDP